MASTRRELWSVGFRAAGSAPGSASRARRRRCSVRSVERASSRRGWPGSRSTSSKCSWDSETRARHEARSAPLCDSRRCPPGLVAVVKRECPTCETVAPVLRELAARAELTVYTQDDLDFPEGLVARRRHRARGLLPPPDRDRADTAARRERRRGGARGGLAPRRLGEAHGDHRAGRGSPRVAARLRVEERRSGHRARARGALRGTQARVAAHRARAARRRGRGAVRARLDRRPARGGAHRAPRARDARGHDARARRGGRDRARPTSRPPPSRRWRSTR